MATKGKKSKQLKVKENGLRAQAHVFNKVALQVSEDVIDLALKNGAAGQRIFKKVLKGGVTIFGMQQDLVLTALEKMVQDERVQEWVKTPMGYFNRFKTTAEETTTTIKETVHQTTEIAKKEVTKVVNEVNKRLDVIINAKNEVVETVADAKDELVETVSETGTEVAEIVVEATEKLENKTLKVVDDLKKINGVGPKMAEVLNNAGYKTFSQLAQANIEDLKKVLAEAGSRYRNFDPTPWVTQAKLAAANNWKGLEAWKKKVSK